MFVLTNFTDSFGCRFPLTVQLSAHQLASDPALGLYPASVAPAYNGHLLKLAASLGARLLPSGAEATNFALAAALNLLSLLASLGLTESLARPKRKRCPPPPP
eukprot:SAG11_NODE_19290_length_470_cov_0.571429_1_plen_102_part_10